MDFPIPGPVVDISSQCLLVTSFTLTCFSLSLPPSVLCQHLGWAQILMCDLTFWHLSPVSYQLSCASCSGEWSTNIILKDLSLLTYYFSACQFLCILLYYKNPGCIFVPKMKTYFEIFAVPTAQRTNIFARVPVNFMFWLWKPVLF